MKVSPKSPRNNCISILALFQYFYFSLFQFLHVFICFQEKTFQIQLFITAMTIIPMVIPTVLAKMGRDLIVVVLLYLNMGLELWVRQKIFFYLFIYFITFSHFSQFYIFLYFVKNDNSMCTIIRRRNILSSGTNTKQHSQSLK